MLNLFPQQRSGDGSQRPGTGRVRSGERFAPVMLKVIKIDFVAPVLLQPLQREQIGTFLSDIPADKMPDPAQAIESDSGPDRNDNLHSGCTGGFGD
ncbi:hypothetical protein D3C73_1435220 [compost metagenome]